MQPIQSPTPRPLGEPPPSATPPGESPLSSEQRTVLERLITRVIALNQQQSAEVWAGLKHDLQLKSDSPLLSRHFPAAEQNLNQRLTQAQNTVSNRQVISQLTELLAQGNNRQAVSDFIRQQFGQTALSQLTPTQLKTVLTLLQDNQLSDSLLSQRSLLANNPLLSHAAQQASHAQPAESSAQPDRPLLPAEHSILNRLVSKLAATTGDSGKEIWKTMLELVNLKPGEPIPARLFAPLSGWLQAHQTLSQHSAPTLLTLQAALKQPLSESERQWLIDYSQQRFQATPQMILSPFQIKEILTQILLIRTKRQSGGIIDVRDIKPIVSPLLAGAMKSIKNISTRSSTAVIALLVAIVVLWILF